VYFYLVWRLAPINFGVHWLQILGSYLAISNVGILAMEARSTVRVKMPFSSQTKVGISAGKF
jgi:hypothetical protein